MHNKQHPVISWSSLQCCMDGNLKITESKILLILLITNNKNNDDKMPLIKVLTNKMIFKKQCITLYKLRASVVNTVWYRVQYLYYIQHGSSHLRVRAVVACWSQVLTAAQTNMQFLPLRVIKNRELDPSCHSNTSKIPHAVQTHQTSTHL